jgi:hypothetical protein
VTFHPPAEPFESDPEKRLSTLSEGVAESFPAPVSQESDSVPFGTVKRRRTVPGMRPSRTVTGSLLFPAGDNAETENPPFSGMPCDLASFEGDISTSHGTAVGYEGFHSKGSVAAYERQNAADTTMAHATAAGFSSCMANPFSQPALRGRR